MLTATHQQSDSFLGYKEVTPAQEFRQPLPYTGSPRKVVRKTNLSVALSLEYHARQLQDAASQMALLKKAKAIRECGSWTRYTELLPGEYSSKGQLRCKDTFCPHCQVVRSKRLTDAFIRFFRVNSDVAQRCHLYHVTLTVPHSVEAGRYQGAYANQLLDDFAWLRGSKGPRLQSRWWNDSVKGGACFVQTTSTQRDSLHVHLHCLLVAAQDLQTALSSNSLSFEEQLKIYWTERTGATEKGVHLERIYWKDGGVKHYYVPFSGQSTQEFMRGIEGCLSYITQGHKPAVLQNINSCLAQELVLKRRRAYIRLGCLCKNALTLDFKQLHLLNCEETSIKRREAGSGKCIALPTHLENQLTLSTDGISYQIPDELLSDAYTFPVAGLPKVPTMRDGTPNDGTGGHNTGLATPEETVTCYSKEHKCFRFTKRMRYAEYGTLKLAVRGQSLLWKGRLTEMCHPIRGPSTGIISSCCS